MDEALKEELAALRERGLYREPRALESAHLAIATFDANEVVSFSSNDYLGFASHPRLVDALGEAARRDGVGSGASRLISGNHRVHLECEARLARFVGTESALLFSSGYAANVGVLSTLLGPGDIVFSDELNHASLIDGCRLSKARVVVFPHRDTRALEASIAEHRPSARRAIIVTDAIFSMDGDRADLGELSEIAKRHDAWLFVDEAHAMGVVGPRGRGLSAAQEVEPEVRVGTLGKAFGVLGAFVAGSTALTDLLRNKARSFVFSTAPPPALAATILAATDLVEAADDRRATLFAHAARLRRELRALGYEVLGDETPIVPVLIGDPDETMAISSALFERGVFAHGIRPPTVPAGTSRIRLVPMAAHTDADIDRVVAAFAALRARPAVPAHP
jgi:8-amino-7-oxononanoate synthase